MRWRCWASQVVNLVYLELRIMDRNIGISEQTLKGCVRQTGSTHGMFTLRAIR